MPSSHNANGYETVRISKALCFSLILRFSLHNNKTRTGGAVEYKVNVHKDVLKQIDALPAATRAEVVRLLSMTADGGHTHLPPDAILYRQENQFDIYAYTDKKSTGFETGVSLKGCFLGVGDKSYYITKMRNIIKGDYVDTGMWRITEDTFTQHPVFIGPFNKAEFIELDIKWFSNIKEKLPVIPDTTTLDPKDLLPKFFYRTLGNMQAKNDHQVSAGSLSPFPNVNAGFGLPSTRGFDVSFLAHVDTVTVQAWINQRVAIKNTVCLVHWMDKQDPFDWVHGELALVTCGVLRKIYPSLRFNLTNVHIRDELGNTPYMDEFIKHGSRHYNSSNMFTEEPKSTLEILGANANMKGYITRFTGLCNEFSRGATPYDLGEAIRGGSSHNAEYNKMLSHLGKSALSIATHVMSESTHFH